MSLRETISDLIDSATSPTAYSIYAGLGVIATTGLAIWATKKFCDNYYEKVLDKKPFETDPPKPRIKETAKTFAPVFLLGAATLYCIYKSNSGWIEYNGIVDSAYTLAAMREAHYQKLVGAAVGVEVIQGLGKRKAEEGLDWYCVKAVGNFPDIYFQAKEADIYNAELQLNRNFQLRGTSSVGEWFAFLPIKDSDLIAAYSNYEKEKDILGWDSDEMLDAGLVPWIDFDYSHVEATETSPWIGVINLSYYCRPHFSEDGSFLASNYRLYPTE